MGSIRVRRTTPRRRPAPAASSLAALASLAGAPFGGAAQQADTARADSSVFRLEGIRIQARRPVTTIGGASAVEVTVDSLGLPPAPTMEDMLRELPAVHIRRNSRGQAEISVRGSESRQVAVLLDGVPLTLGWDARTDVSVLPAGAVRDVNFVRGLSSILHGPNVLGGVVEMHVTGDRRPAESSSSWTAGINQEAGYSLAADVTRPFETAGGYGVIRAGAGFRDTRGVPLADGVEEPVPVDGNRRLNTDFQNVDGFFAVRYVSDEGPWGSLSATGHRSERGIAAELGAESPRLWREPDVHRTIVALSGGTGQRETPLGVGDLETSVGVDVGRTEIRSFDTRAYRNVVGRENGDDRTITVRLLGDHTLGPRAELRSAFTFADVDHDEIVDGVERDFRQRFWSLGGETAARLWDDPGGTVRSVRLSAGAAWDRTATPLTGGLDPLPAIDDWGVRVGLSALLDGGETLLHFGASRRGRFPSLREAFSEAIDRFVPNPDLRAEHLFAVEGGVTTRVRDGDVQVVGFRNRTNDAIRRITFEDGRRQRVNSERLRSFGVEILASQSVGPFALSGDLTLQSVKLTDPDARTSREAENLPETSGRVSATVPFLASATLTAEAEFTGSQFCQDPDTGADVELDAGTWLNGSLSRVWDAGPILRGRRLETRVSVANLADTRLYDQCGLPRHGRLFGFQVRMF